MEYNVTCKSWNLYVIVNKISYRKLSEFFTRDLELCEEQKVKNSFLENKTFEQSFGLKINDFKWWIHSRTTSLLIGENNG